MFSFVTFGGSPWFEIILDEKNQVRFTQKPMDITYQEALHMRLLIAMDTKRVVGLLNGVVLMQDTFEGATSRNPRI